MAQNNLNHKKTTKRKNRKVEGSPTVLMRDWQTGHRVLAPSFDDIPYEEREKETKRLEKKLGNRKI